jgi:membrane protease YdiL (CAAX protease family)
MVIRLDCSENLNGWPLMLLNGFADLRLWAGRWATVAGLRAPAVPICSKAFALSALLAVPVCAGLAWVSSASLSHGAVAWLSLVLWQPLLEEFCFRGLLQGELSGRWGARHVGLASWANLATTLAFVGAHLVHQPWVWALAVAPPSLIFGWWRERSGSIWPGLLLHAGYNGCFGVTACLVAQAAL